MLVPGAPRFLVPSGFRLVCISSLVSTTAAWSHSGWRLFLKGFQLSQPNVAHKLNAITRVGKPVKKGRGNSWAFQPGSAHCSASAFQDDARPGSQGSRLSVFVQSVEYSLFLFVENLQDHELEHALFRKVLQYCVLHLLYQLERERHLKKPPLHPYI